MWFDVSGNFSPKSISTWWEASCRMSTKNCGHSSPCARSRMLIFCALDLSSPHISPQYHHNVTFSQLDPNGTAISPGAISLQHVQPWFFLFSHYLTRFFNVGLKGPQFHSPVGPPPWHTWAPIRCRFAALQSDWGTHRLAWSQWNWQWCLLQLANDIGSSSREKCDTSQCRAHLKHKVAEKVLMRRKRDVESSSDLNVLQCTSMIFNVHYNTIVRECQRSFFYRAISYVIYIYIVLNYTHMLHGAGIFTYMTGWFMLGKCWDSYSSTMGCIWDI